MESRQRLMILDYPYPYRALLSISNDIDFMPFNSFLALHEYFGSPPDQGGLGLEYTDSLFFFNNGPADRHFSFYDGATTAESVHAAPLKEILKAGYIDTVHAYGCFNNGSFYRGFAEAVCDLLRHLEVTIPVWVNHGSFGNVQNISDDEFRYFQQGDQYESAYYHRDLLDEIGVRYYSVCSSYTDHFISSLYGGVTPPWRQPSKQYMLALPWRRRAASRMPLNPSWPPRSSVLYPIKTGDGVTVQGYHRFRGFPGAPPPDLGRIPLQVTKERLDELCDKEGSVVLYQHFGTVLRSPERVVLDEALSMSPAILQTLEIIAGYHHEGKIWVAGLARALDYITMRNEVKVEQRLSHEGRLELIVKPRYKRRFKHGYEGLSVKIDDQARQVVFVEGGDERPAVIHHDPALGRIAQWPITSLPDINWREYRLTND